MTGETYSLEIPASSARTGAWALFFIVLFSLVHVYVSVMLIPKFTEIFNDMSLVIPGWTVSIIRYRWMFVGLDCIWILAAFFIVPMKASAGFLYGILAILLLEIGFTMIALFLPVIGHIEKLSD